MWDLFLEVTNAATAAFKHDTVPLHLTRFLPPTKTKMSVDYNLDKFLRLVKESTPSKKQRTSEKKGHIDS